MFSLIAASVHSLSSGGIFVVSNARGGKKALRRERNGEESAAKAPAKEIPPATQTTQSITLHS